ncbi:MAG: MATE family efflux transporter [Deltaproteobacteria bacterium]|nr:MATE family efflux transporter [Deltaproteobacteria bacterium]
MRTLKALKQRWSSEGGYRQFLAIAFPLILSTGALSVQHFVDRMFLSWYSPEAIAAAMPAGMLNFCIMSLFIGTAAYVNTFVAQYFGAGRKNRIGPVVWQGIYVSALGGLGIMLLVPFSEPIFRLVGHEAAIQKLEVGYFAILCLGAGPMIASTALAGFFSGRGRTWPVMWVNILATGINLLLDYILVFGLWGFPEMGIRGAGIATVLSSVFSLLLYIPLVFRPLYDEEYHTVKGWRLEKDLFIRLLRFGFPSGVQFFLDMSGFTVFILLIGHLGTVSLAATNIAFNISTLSFMPMIGSSIAISVLVGQYLGKNQPEMATTSVYSGFHLTFAYMSVIALAYLFIPELFVLPFAAGADPAGFAEIYRLTVLLLRFVAVYSIFDTMNLVFASAIKGAGDTRYVMFAIVIASALVLVTPTYLGVVVMGWGLMASWINVSAYVIVLSIIFLIRFLGGKWKSMRVIDTSDV